MREAKGPVGPLFNRAGPNVAPVFSSPVRGGGAVRSEAEGGFATNPILLNAPSGLSGRLPRKRGKKAAAHRRESEMRHTIRRRSTK